MLKLLSLLLLALGLPSFLLGGRSSEIPPRTARIGISDVMIGLISDIRPSALAFAGLSSPLLKNSIKL
uniref:Uncharacterized protein n=1 Tax=Setaria viridis TaxID=4556 RepID=A0A4U6VC73_SETVI|nr:hypothetical protein SEVIR_4G127601v2 [Setaria viridis]